ncbi:MAG: hypothetical protein PHC92_11960 [Syntrophomonadaceae bacterium]|nr:hypothetical protein [Syntrophomonadaceae bacterium]MDD3024907.1 hypothetical protein [Syntrophomonadaceae bacterium]
MNLIKEKAQIICPTCKKDMEYDKQDNFYLCSQSKAQFWPVENTIPCPGCSRPMRYKHLVITNVPVVVLNSGRQKRRVEKRILRSAPYGDPDLVKGSRQIYERYSDSNVAGIDFKAIFDLFRF